MLTIWNKFIQQLLFSEDQRTKQLALALVDNKMDVYRWWAISGKFEEAEAGLPSSPFCFKIWNSNNGVNFISDCVDHRWIHSEACFEQLREKFKLLNKK